MIWLMLIVIGAAVAIGRWRKFTSVHWIWTIAGLAIALVVLWALVLMFFIGPEMRDAKTPW